MTEGVQNMHHWDAYIRRDFIFFSSLPWEDAWHKNRGIPFLYYVTANWWNLFQCPKEPHLLKMGQTLSHLNTWNILVYEGDVTGPTAQSRREFSSH